MAKAEMARKRLSIDVFPEEHKRIKVYAALQGQTLREYVVESVRERLRYEVEERERIISSNYEFKSRFYCKGIMG